MFGNRQSWEGCFKILKPQPWKHFHIILFFVVCAGCLIRRGLQYYFGFDMNCQNVRTVTCSCVGVCKDIKNSIKKSETFLFFLWKAVITSKI